MKQALLEYIIRSCVKEVLSQVKEGPETIAQMHGGKVVNDNEFTTDKHGTWCGRCGGSASSKVISQSPLTYAYTCGDERCFNHTYPPNQQAFNSQDVNEGDEADAMDDQDQELHANRDQEEQERTRLRKNRPKTVCQQCKGKGGHWAKLKDKSGKSGDGMGVDHYVSCNFPGCHNGMVDSEENYRSFVGERGLKKEDDETKGAPAPPADGLGSADQPPVPKNDDGEDDLEDETPEEKPEAPAPTNLKGVILVNPRDKSSLKQIPLRAGDEAGIERNLHAVAATLAGSNVKIAISTMRAVKDALRNPSASVYVYLGKYDPQSDEVFLMADKSLQVAKDSSIEPTEVQGSTFASKSAPEHPDDVATQMLNRGYVQPNDPIDENLKATIKTMVNRLLDGK